MFGITYGGFSLNKQQLKDLIINPTLMEMGPQFASPYAVELLLGTAAQESHLGEYIKQLGNGPALGIYQMEPATYRDIWENFIRYRHEIKRALVRMFPDISTRRASDVSEWQLIPPPAERMIYDLKFATVMARLHYYRVDEPLPRDPQEYAMYWKTYYNTEEGKGTVAEFLHNWARFC